jgi:threonine/homoserine/homoserine lactone efflux protein
MLEFILPAFTFGLVAGLKPGPLGIIVIQQTLTHGLGSGVRASLAPLITDGPIILVALLVLPLFQDFNPFVAGLSLLGGGYLVWIGSKLMRARSFSFGAGIGKGASLTEAVKVNFLSPAPYLFWFTVGGAYILLGTIAQSAVFVGVAVGTLVAGKMFVALLAATARPWLSSSAYSYVMRVLAGGLVLFGFLLFVRSYELLAGGRLF